MESMQLRINSPADKYDASVAPGVECISDPAPYSEKEMLYLAIRSAEERLYNDQQIKDLPRVPKTHPYAKEWAARRHSAEILDAMLGGETNSLKIMDLGCGNGWLSNRLCCGTRNTVYGVDLNMLELIQGRRVFAHNTNLSFCYANIFEPDFPLKNLDLIVVASAIQYFPDLQTLFSRLFSMLKEDGKIHIIDSPFYAAKDVSEAKERTRIYYAKLGFPEMADYYYHHTLESLSEYNYYKLEPGFRSKISWHLGNGGSPFPYYIIKKK
jgi:ubiquinone/menaquinone biosynthesis C-methylase UbiE